MADYGNKLEHCTICKDEYTSTHVEVVPNVIIFVCENCLDAAKYNFIWICMGCGQVYVRPKKMVIERTKSYQLKSAYMLCEDLQIIQGIDMCIKCDPNGVYNYRESQKLSANC